MPKTYKLYLKHRNNEKMTFEVQQNIASYYILPAATVSYHLL